MLAAAVVAAVVADGAEAKVIVVVRDWETNAGIEASVAYLHDGKRDSIPDTNAATGIIEVDEISCRVGDEIEVATSDPDYFGGPKTKSCLGGQVEFKMLRYTLRADLENAAQKHANSGDYGAAAQLYTELFATTADTKYLTAIYTNVARALGVGTDSAMDTLGDRAVPSQKLVAAVKTFKGSNDMDSENGHIDGKLLKVLSGKSTWDAVRDSSRKNE